MEDSQEKCFEYFGTHIKDYIKGNKLFQVFDIDGIELIFKHAKFNVNDYISLLEQSYSTNHSGKLSAVALKASVSMNNFEEVISTLKSIRQCLNLRFFAGLIDFLYQTENELIEKTKQIADYKKSVNNLIQNLRNDTNCNLVKKNSDEFDYSMDFLLKIIELRALRNYEQTYKFLSELSEEGDKTKFSKACEAGLCQIERINKSFKNYILEDASEKGNLKLVKLLLECENIKNTNCNSMNESLIIASKMGHREIVKALISFGADKETCDSEGKTPFIYAS